MLIANLNSSGSANVNVNINGAALGQSGMTWLYGVNQTTPLTTSLATGLGSSFLLNVPFQSVLAVLINAAPSLPGDFNQDGLVDTADYVVWRNGLGSTYTQDDYDVWRTHFGATAAAGMATISVVPEPAPFVLFLIGATALCGYRKSGLRST